MAELRFAALTAGMMEWWNIGMLGLEDWEYRSIIDASRLDLSSPAQAIHHSGLMNQTVKHLPSVENKEQNK